MHIRVLPTTAALAASVFLTSVAPAAAVKAGYMFNGQRALVLYANSPLRNGESDSATILILMPKSTGLSAGKGYVTSVREQSESGSWCEVNYKGKVGFTGCWRLKPATAQEEAAAKEEEALAKQKAAEEAQKPASPATGTAAPTTTTPTTTTPTTPTTTTTTTPPAEAAPSAATTPAAAEAPATATTPAAAEAPTTARQEVPGSAAKPGKPGVHVKVTVKWTWRRGHTKMDWLKVGRLPRGTSVGVVYTRKRGRQAHESRDAATRRQLRALIRWLEHKHYRAGDRLSLDISRHGYQPERATFEIRAGRHPKLTKG